MQSTQKKRKDSTAISEQKAESAFAPIPRKRTQLFLLDKILIPVPKAESAILADLVFQFSFCRIL